MNQSYPTTFQKKILWRALTGVSISVLIILVISSIWLVSETLSYLQPVLIPVAVAGIIAYLLDPIVAWFQRRGMPRLRAVIYVFGSFFAASLLFLALIIPPIAEQIGNEAKRKKISYAICEKLEDLKENTWFRPVADYLTAPVDPDYVPLTPEPTEDTLAETAALEASPTELSVTEPSSATEQATAEEINETEEVKEHSFGVPFTETRLGVALADNKEKILSTATAILTQGTGKLIGYIGLLVGMIMIPIYLYYFLTESASIKDNWHLYVPLKASKFKTEVVSTLQEINGYLIAFFRGQVLVAFIDGMLVGITLCIFCLPYGLVIGVLMAFLGVIPFIGNLICLIPACIIAFVHFSVAENQHILGSSPWAYVGAVVAIFFIVQQINSLITAPKIVGDSVGLHPMTVIFSMLFWSLILGGFVGTLLAVPMTAAVKVIFVRYIWERKIMECPSEGAPDSKTEESPTPA